MKLIPHEKLSIIANSESLIKQPKCDQEALIVLPLVRVKRAAASLYVIHLRDADAGATILTLNNCRVSAGRERRDNR